ncbi:MAG: hypoxanthine phosphoribosyltransferase [Bacilli bacterium]|nr:hypoxanthine phosphoribosyltransferase [Bacilli bacterium]
MKELVLSEEDISAIVQRLGKRLTEDLADEKVPPVFVCVMKGALPFFGDLIKQVKRDIVCDFIQLTSYNGGLSSSGTVRIEKDIQTDLDDRTVVIVEDIVDTGLSMQFLLEHINSRFHPKRLLICALFNKEKARKVPVKVDYTGVVLNDTKFLIGYGLDYKELFRNLPYVCVPTEEEIAAVDGD